MNWGWGGGGGGGGRGAANDEDKEEEEEEEEGFTNAATEVGPEDNDNKRCADDSDTDEETFASFLAIFALGWEISKSITSVVSDAIDLASSFESPLLALANWKQI